MPTIAFINQKGGVAKTTSSVHVATALAAFLHKRTLLVDLDPQAQACLTFGYDKAGTTREVVKLGHLLEHAEEGNADLSTIYPQALLQTGIENLDLLPGQKTIRRYFVPPAGQEERVDLVSLLITAIQRAGTPADQRASTYDWVIFDTPPSLDAPTKNAIVAADIALVPIEPSKYSVEGFGMFLEGVNALLPKWGKNADDFYRILPTRVNPSATRAKADMYEYLREFQDRFLMYRHPERGQAEPAYIRQCVALSHCVTQQTTVFTFDPKSHGAHDYYLLTQLIVAYAKQKAPHAAAAAHA
jgi:chromosome partitioning protein